MSFESPRRMFTHVFPKLFSVLNANVSKCINGIVVFSSLSSGQVSWTFVLLYWFLHTGIVSMHCQFHRIAMASNGIGIASDWRLLVLRSHASRFTDRMSVSRKLWEKQIMQISKFNAHPHMQVHSHAHAHAPMPCTHA